MATDKNGNDFIQRKGFFLTNRKDRGSKYFLNFAEGSDKGIPSTGFKNLAEAQAFIDFIRPEKPIRPARTIRN